MKELETKDIRILDLREVCSLDEWLDKYMRLEHPGKNDSGELLNVLVRSTREFESDFGVFRTES